jgi:hypothetical protein
MVAGRNGGTIMRHWYVVFSGGTSPATAHQMLKQWGAKPESDQPAVPMEGGDLALAVEGPDTLQDLVKDTPGIDVYDNETHQELY